LILYIAGRKEIITSNLTTGNVLTTANTLYYVYLNFNTIPNASQISVTTLAPVYSRTQPSCPGSGVTAFWFDAGTRLMKSCTTPSTFAASPVLFLGVIVTDGSKNSAGIAHEPWGLDPLTRMREFGSGATRFSTTGSNTCDGWNQYDAVELPSATPSLTHTAINPTNNAPDAMRGLRIQLSLRAAARSTSQDVAEEEAARARAREEAETQTLAVSAALAGAAVAHQVPGALAAATVNLTAMEPPAEEPRIPVVRRNRRRTFPHSWVFHRWVAGEEAVVAAEAVPAAREPRVEEGSTSRHPLSSSLVRPERLRLTAAAAEQPMVRAQTERVGTVAAVEGF
jgi:hypothetical protein